MKKRASEALNSSELVTFRSLDEEEEGFIGIDDDGSLILKSKVKEENGNTIPPVYSLSRLCLCYCTKGLYR